MLSWTDQRLHDLIAFHGHFCPGLATGVRVAEAALAALGPRAEDEELVAIVETNNCAVDAIQFLTGCTYGKGNLIHLDHGKNVFTLARRNDGRAVRMTVKASDGRGLSPEQQRLVERVRSDEADDQELAAYAALWEDRGRAILDAPVEELLAVQELTDYTLPDKATIEPSQECEGCGALVMASRLTPWRGQRLCATCLQQAGGAALHMASIGVVHNELEPGTAPPRVRSPRSRLVIRPAYRQGLHGLAVGQRVHVLFAFDRSPEEAPLLQHPRGDTSVPKRGVFALRSPHRPSRIGLTTVEILAVESDGLVVAGLDAWNGSPILDIKPLSPELDGAGAASLASGG
jgi:formylmethanofuran dehydrogenase subunit E